MVMNEVYVLSPDRVPLMPCSCAIARLLLKQGKAKVVRRTPFTIKLHTPPEGTYTQPLTLGIDTGSSVIGAAVSDASGNVLYLSEVEVRNDIAQIMKERAALRRNRRQRKTRSPATLVEPQELDQDGALLTHDEKQNRRASAGNPFCAILVADHVHGPGNRNL
jgi:RRXRR protein